jgi:hypothetical protein
MGRKAKMFMGVKEGQKYIQKEKRESDYVHTLRRWQLLMKLYGL